MAAMEQNLMAPTKTRILVVEDEPVTREIVTRYLQGAGFDTLSALSGEEALEILRSNGPAIDWLLTDINLPGCIDGWIVGAEFHLSYPLRSVVYASAFAPRSRAPTAGGVYVPKPYSPAAIVDLLRRLAAQDNGTRSTADALGLIEAA
jgi:CheY-like chemotaxis protein